MWAVCGCLMVGLPHGLAVLFLDHLYMVCVATKLLRGRLPAAHCHIVALCGSFMLSKGSVSAAQAAVVAFQHAFL
jgi:hypothetical protein